MRMFFQRYPQLLYKKVLVLAAPLVLINLTQVIMQFCDRKFLSMQSSESMAAAMPSGLLVFTLASFFMATIAFATPMVSQYFGKEDFVACVRVPWVAARLALLSALAFLCVIAPLGYLLIIYSGHSETMIAYEKLYYLSLVPGFACVFFTFAFNSFFSGRGITWIPSAVQVITCITNIVLNYILIFGHFGSPELGILGAGLATSFANLLALAITIFIFLCVDQKKFKTRQFRLFSSFDFKQLFRLGSSSGLHILSDMSAFTTVIFLIGTLGTVALATSTIAMTINMISFMPLLGMSEAVSILAGQSIGRGRVLQAEKTAYATWQMGTIYTIIIATLYVIFGSELCSLFKPHNLTELTQFEEVVKVGQVVLYFVAFYCILDSMVFIFMGGMRGAGDTRVPMLIVFALCWFIWVPVTYYLVNAGFGLYYVWGYVVVHLVCLATGIIWRYRSGAWKRIKVVKQEIVLQNTEAPFI